MYVRHFVTDDLPTSLMEMELCSARCRAMAETEEQRAVSVQLERAVANLVFKARIARAMWGEAPSHLATDAPSIPPSADGPDRASPGDATMM